MDSKSPAIDARRPINPDKLNFYARAPYSFISYSRSPSIRLPFSAMFSSRELTVGIR